MGGLGGSSTMSKVGNDPSSSLSVDGDGDLDLSLTGVLFFLFFFFLSDLPVAGVGFQLNGKSTSQSFSNSSLETLEGDTEMRGEALLLVVMDLDLGLGVLLLLLPPPPAPPSNNALLVFAFAFAFAAAAEKTGDTISKRWGEEVASASDKPKLESRLLELS